MKKKHEKLCGILINILIFLLIKCRWVNRICVYITKVNIQEIYIISSNDLSYLKKQAPILLGVHRYMTNQKLKGILGWIAPVTRFGWQHNFPDSKVDGAKMGHTWGRQDPGGPHAGPMNLATKDYFRSELCSNHNWFTNKSITNNYV